MRLNALFRLAFAPAPSFSDLTSPHARNSSAHSSKGTPSGYRPKPTTPSDCLWARGFRYYFTPLIGVLFTFPSRYSFTIGRQEYLALDGGPPGFPHERPSTWYSGTRPGVGFAFAYGAVTLYGWPFHATSASEPICNSLRAVQCTAGRPYNTPTATAATCHATRVWAPPLSLATTHGMSVYSSRYLDVSVPSVSSIDL